MRPFEALPAHFYPFSAVLFDMDGTVIDNVPLHQAVWAEFTRLHGLNLSGDQLAFAKGRKAIEAVEHFWPAASPSEVASLTAARQALYRERLTGSDLVTPVAGVEAFLRALGKLGIPRVLATSAPLLNVQAVLREFPLAPLFEAIVASDDIHHGKPHPEIFLTAAARAGAAPSRCLVAEDSEAGVVAAKAAGCFCLGLATTQSEADLRRQGADYVATDFLNLPAGVAVPGDIASASRSDDIDGVIA
jgi:HAD superfamily hydrolase (TIGR01509 family)